MVGFSKLRLFVFIINSVIHFKGLWHNSLFTRIVTAKRFALDQYRLAFQFGEKLYLDFSFTDHLDYHVSEKVAGHIQKLIRLNFTLNISNIPFYITLSGVNYQHHIWKILTKNFWPVIRLISHTSSSFFELESDHNRFIYFTSLEKRNIIDFRHDHKYVLSVIPESNLEANFFNARFNPQKIKTFGVPIDKHLLWKIGNKRLSLITNFKILNHLQNQKQWKEIFADVINPDKLKTIDEIRIENLKLKAKTRRNLKAKFNINY